MRRSSSSTRFTRTIIGNRRLQQRLHPIKTLGVSFVAGALLISLMHSLAAPMRAGEATAPTLLAIAAQCGIFGLWMFSRDAQFAQIARVLTWPCKLFILAAVLVGMCNALCALGRGAARSRIVYGRHDPCAGSVRAAWGADQSRIAVPART